MSTNWEAEEFAKIPRNALFLHTYCNNPSLLFWAISQGSVVQKVDDSIHWINFYPEDNAIGFPDAYPPDSDLSSG